MSFEDDYEHFSPNMPSTLEEDDDSYFRFPIESKYRPLQVQLPRILNQLRPQGAVSKVPHTFDIDTMEYRMDLAVASKRYPLMFMALRDRIGVYTTPTAHGWCEPSNAIHILNKPFPDDGSKGYLAPGEVPHQRLPY
jgi:hypothetical protein